MFGGTRADRRGIHVPTNELFVLDHREHGVAAHPAAAAADLRRSELLGRDADDAARARDERVRLRRAALVLRRPRLWRQGARRHMGLRPPRCAGRSVPSPNERTPPARFSHDAVAVSVHRFVVFGGYGVGANNATRLLGDVWALDISDESSQGWIQLTETALNTVDVSAGVSGAAPTTKAAQMSLGGGDRPPASRRCCA